MVEANGNRDYAGLTLRYVNMGKMMRNRDLQAEKGSEGGPEAISRNIWRDQHPERTRECARNRYAARKGRLTPICVFCGKPRPASQTKFCGEPCYNGYWNWRQRQPGSRERAKLWARSKRKLIEVLCAGCGSQFTTTNRGRKYCSGDCQKRAVRERERAASASRRAYLQAYKKKNIEHRRELDRQQREQRRYSDLAGSIAQLKAIYERKMPNDNA